MNSFITGVWYQPTSLIPTWASRGCNTLMGYNYDPATYVVDYPLWKAAAVANGMKYIVQWSAGLLTGADNSDPNLAGVLHVDEPDGIHNTTPGTIIDTYNVIKAALPSKPVYLNVDGRVIPNRPFSDYKCYAYGADVLSSDTHVINFGDGPQNIPQIGVNTDTLIAAGKAAGGVKKYMAILECSDQNLRISNFYKQYPQIAALMRGPTATEMALEVNQVIARAASGVIWFPDRIGVNFEAFDGMNAEQVASMTTLNTMLRNR